MTVASPQKSIGVGQQDERDRRGQSARVVRLISMSEIVMMGHLDTECEIPLPDLPVQWLRFRLKVVKGFVAIDRGGVAFLPHDFAREQKP